MSPTTPWCNRAILYASLFTGVGAANLIDGFLYGGPAEFNLPAPAAQWLGLAFFAALAGLIAQAGRGRHQAFKGLILLELLAAFTSFMALRETD